MAGNPRDLGFARVYQDPGTGELLVDGDTLRRGQFAGEDPDGGFGYDADDEEPDTDFEGENEDDGDFEGDPDIGARDRKKKNHSRRSGRRKSGSTARNSGAGSSSGGGENRRPRQATPAREVVVPSEQWGMTAVSGNAETKEAGPVSVQIRLQHNFKAQDITFQGSSAGAKVTSIFFGDRAVWSNPDGIPVEVFASNSAMRGLLKGQALQAGLDITVNGTLSGEGSFTPTLIGAKPVGV